MCTQCVTYYHRLLTSQACESNYKLLDATFNTMKDYKHPWLQGIHMLLRNGLGDLFESLTGLENKECVKKMVECRLRDMYTQENMSKITEKEYINTQYKCIKDPDYKCQKYISQKKGPTARNMFSKLRTNSPH